MSVMLAVLVAVAAPVVLELDPPSTDGTGIALGLGPVDAAPDAPGRVLGGARRGPDAFVVVRRGRAHTLVYGDDVVPLARDGDARVADFRGGTVAYRPDLNAVLFRLPTRRSTRWGDVDAAIIDLEGQFATGDLALDADGDGVDLADPRVPLGTPFDHDGRTWTAALDGDRLVLTPTDEAAGVLQAGHTLPSMVVTDLAGVDHDLAASDRTVLVDFWGTWCGPCIAALPKVEAAAAEHGLAVLGVAADRPGAVKAFLAKNGGPAWPQVAEERTGPLHAAFRIQAWPSYAVVGAGGTLHYVGPDLDDALAALP